MMILHKRIVRTLLLAAIMSISIGVNGADIRSFTHSSDSYRGVVIEGDIESGDFDKLIKLIRDNSGHIGTVYLFSPGGDYHEAMRIGRAIRSLELASMVPMRDSSGRPACSTSSFVQRPNDPNNCTCASACFFVHIGSIHRGGTFLMVHRPYFTKGRFGNLSEVNAKKAFDALQNSARDYMHTMGVPRHIQEDVLGTPSDRGLVLDEKTIKTYFWGTLPHRHEWIKNKCSRLSDEESLRMERYSVRLLKPMSSPEANFSMEELTDLQAIRKKQDETLGCTVAIYKQNRIDAYKKYFQVAPSPHMAQ